MSGSRHRSAQRRRTLATAESPATLFQSTALRAAHFGTYVVSWQSLQSKPTVKAAPFRLRADGPTGPVLAELTYKTEMNGNTRYHNGTRLVGPSWTQNVAQRFEITIDCAVRTGHLAPTTRLRNYRAFDKLLQYTGSEVPFYNTSATNLVRFAAELSGIDAGIMAVDDVFIGRRVDPLQ